MPTQVLKGAYPVGLGIGAAEGQPAAPGLTVGTGRLKQAVYSRSEEESGLEDP